MTLSKEMCSNGPRLLMSDNGEDPSIFNPYGYGIMCGPNLCEFCCIREHETCGAAIDCSEEFSALLFSMVAISTSVLLAIAILIIARRALSGKAEIERLAQTILHRHYTKMCEEKSVAITIGQIVEENAPIKQCTIVEGMSDVDSDLSEMSVTESSG